MFGDPSSWRVTIGTHKTTIWPGRKTSFESKKLPSGFALARAVDMHPVNCSNPRQFTAGMAGMCRGCFEDRTFSGQWSDWKKTHITTHPILCETSLKVTGFLGAWTHWWLEKHKDIIAFLVWGERLFSFQQVYLRSLLVGTKNICTRSSPCYRFSTERPPSNNSVKQMTRNCHKAEGNAGKQVYQALWLVNLPPLTYPAGLLTIGFPW